MLSSFGKLEKVLCCLLDADKLINGLTFDIDTQEIEPNRYGEVIAVTYEKRYLHKKADNTKLKSEMTKRNLDLMPFFDY